MMYRVNLVKMVSYLVEVEAEDEYAAIDLAFDQAPGICARCSGWNERWSLDDSNEWSGIEDFHGDQYDPQLHGRTVETA